MANDKKISELPLVSTIGANDSGVLVKTGTDYQFSFNTLLQFIGSELTVGANLFFGDTIPQNLTGKNGDVFVNIINGYFAQKVNGTWIVVYTPSAGIADGTVLYGISIPESATGKNNDTYINTLSGVFYKKSDGVWNQAFSMQTGPAGATGSTGATGPAGVNGKTILSGTGNPSNLYTGSDGDYYINIANYYFFGPKAAGVWPLGFSLYNLPSESVILPFTTGSANPIVIDNYQNNYASDLGNRPSIIITEKLTDDGVGNLAEIDRNDIRPIRYYSDSPDNTLLSRISIDTGSGAVLTNSYLIKIST
ncbi:hypothetical protein SAMN05216464_110201 [Mucilaginibacter pineti]|uniref:Collagen triple helix repeat-containing protein n=1 Tax=Mucilaginibacter pineti TaxID=1391627 RepID=A0A1G7GLG3_9SPHI|nr:hypothetical protein [Mucilaginibacter pineti]SDE88975.1 hypothetical protein SAMN05216464_110201 [Mucilaginibacter pineti]